MTRAPALLLAALASVVVCAAAAALPAPAHAAAQLELVPADGAPRTLLARAGGADRVLLQLGWAPDGSSLTYLRTRRFEWDPASAAAFRQPAAGGPGTLLRNAGPSGDAALSPDGRLMVEGSYRTRAGRIVPFVVRDVATGAVLTRVRATQPPQTGPIVVEGDEPRLCWSPDARRLAIVERDPRARRTVTRVLDLPSRRLTRVREEPADEGCFAPDGRLMLAPRTGAGEAARLLDLATGAQRAVPDTGRDADAGVTWAPDMRRLAYPSGEGIAVVDAATGRGPVLPIVPDTSPEDGIARHVTDVRWSPDGRTLAVVYDEGDLGYAEDPRRGPSLIVLPADGSAPPRELVRATRRSLITDIAWSPDGTRIALASARLQPRSDR